MCAIAVALGLVAPEPAAADAATEPIVSAAASSAAGGAAPALAAMGARRRRAPARRRPVAVSSPPWRTPRRAERPVPARRTSPAGDRRDVDRPIGSPGRILCKRRQPWRAHLQGMVTEAGANGVRADQLSLLLPCRKFSVVSRRMFPLAGFDLRRAIKNYRTRYAEPYGTALPQLVAQRLRRTRLCPREAHRVKVQLRRKLDPD
jgi:hypothetical protein